MYRPWVLLSLGQGVLLKYFWLASDTNEPTVQGACLFSRSMTMSPRLVTTVAVYVAEVSGVAGGGDTLRAAVPFGV